MSYLDETSVCVDVAVEESVITHMNELLIELSDGIALGREDRYTQQQRLCTAIAHHSRQHKEDMKARRGQLVESGIIPRYLPYPTYRYILQVR